MVVLALVPLPVRISPELCKCSDAGKGVAVWQDLLVISSCKELQVFALPRDIARGGVCGPKRELVHVRTLGGAAPMEFGFFDSGSMAFTEGGLLLVTDRGTSFRDVDHGTVHVIDVVRGIHVGYVAARGLMKYLRGVATRKSLAAVSCCGRIPEVRVFEDIKEGDGSQAGWVICYDEGFVAVADNDADAITGRRTFYLEHPLAFAAVPGLGLLVVRHMSGVQFFATPDAVAMASMSFCKVAWMAVVLRRAACCCDSFQ